MKRIFLELIIILSIGGLLWAAFSFFIKFPENPTLISAEKESQIGQIMYDNLIENYNFELVENETVDNILNEISDSINHQLNESEYIYHISIIKSDIINAFALPGGQIIITTGLVNFCQNAEELFAVIAHEVGHIEKKHFIERLIKQLGISILTSNDPFITKEIAAEILSQKYNRNQENEADLFACNFLQKFQIEPRILASLFNRLKHSEDYKNYQNFELFSSHPEMSKRVKRILSFKLDDSFKTKELWFKLEDIKVQLN